MAENALDRAKELQDRSKRFAVRIVKMFRQLYRGDAWAVTLDSGSSC